MAVHSTAGGGRKPLEDRSGVRNRVPVKQWTEVPNVPYLEGRKHRLPGPAEIWHEQTRKWWGSLRTMPHCILWEETDWQFALTTALLHNLCWSGEDIKKSGELRMRERLMGLTAESRVDMRIRYVEPGDEPTQGTKLAPVVAIGFDQPAKKRPRAIDPAGARP